MATIEHWNKYMNLLHEFALVEDDLRQIVASGDDGGWGGGAARILYERFWVDTP